MAGTVLAEEFPFASAVYNNHLPRTCANCFDTRTKVFCCSKCEAIFYCDLKCQQQDQLFHEIECKVLVKMYPNIPQHRTRLFLRSLIARRLKPGEMAFNGRTYESLMSHVIDMSSDRYKLLHFVIAQEVILGNTEGKDIPRKYITLENFGKMIINSFELHSTGHTKIGSALYLGLSALNHSCRPSTFIIFDGDKAILKGINESVIDYSDQLTVSYINTFKLTRERKEDLVADFYIDCTCSICADDKFDLVAESLRCSQCLSGNLLIDPTLQMVIRCTQCSNPRPINSMKSCLLIKQRVQNALNRIESGDLSMFADDSAYQLFRRAARYLSQSNLLLCNYADTVASELLTRNSIKYAGELIERSLEGYMKLYPDCYEKQSEKYRTLSMIFLKNDPVRALPVLKKTVELGEIVYGPEHSITMQYRGLVDSNEE